MEKILIIRLSAIGDVVHALPCLEVLRRARPDARIGWIVEEMSAPLLEGHPGIDRLYVIPKSRWRGQWHRVWWREVAPFFHEVRSEGWTVSVDFQGLSKSGLVGWASGARVRVGYGDHDGREISRLFYNRRVVPPPGARHVVERNLSLLESLGLEVPRTAVYGTVALREPERDWARRFFSEWGVDSGREVAAINSGAGWKTKRWPVGHFIEAAEGLWRELGLRPLVLWGPKEESARDRIVETLRRRNVDVRAAPSTGLRELSALVREVALFIGGDTGPTHLAAMQGVATVGLFGGSDPVRNGPWGPRVAALQTSASELPCIPCWKQQCRLPREDKETIPCLERLSPGRVVEAARVLLRGG